MRRPRNPSVMIDGLSLSCWKSLVVKALRVGWSPGIEAAAARIPPATMRDLLFVGIYEDVWPSLKELPDVVDEIKRGDYESLCLRETLHGRGYATVFFEDRQEAMGAVNGIESDRLRDLSRRLDTPLWKRGLNCLYTWDKVQPGKTKFRSIDTTPFKGMPLCVADSHTFEGKKAGVYMTVLSGHYEQHYEIGKIVMQDGWGPIREEMHAAFLTGKAWQMPAVTQPSLLSML